MKAQRLKNNSEWLFYMTGKNCYITPAKIAYGKHCKKSDFLSLLEGKNDFNLYIESKTENRYISKILQAGYEMIESLPFDKYSNQYYFAKAL